MATVSDIENYFAGQAELAIYPNGTSQPSVAPVPPGFTNPMDVLVYVGWPIAQQLDLDMAGMMIPPNNPQGSPIARPNGPRAHVCVNVGHGGRRLSPFQILDNIYTIVPAQIKLVVTTSGTPGAFNTEVTITGTPATGEFVTILADGNIYSQTGASASAILNALLTAAQVNFPTSSINGNTLTIPAFYEFVVRQGGVGTQAKVTHRQCQLFIITSWAPDHHTRSFLADQVDILLKQNNIVTMPDTSQALVTFNRLHQSSEMQNQTIYRRDIYYEVEYATLEQFPAVTVTSITTTLAGDGTPTPPQINFIS